MENRYRFSTAARLALAKHFKYADDQPRDDHGRFASSGGASSGDPVTGEKTKQILSSLIKPEENDLPQKATHEFADKASILDAADKERPGYEKVMDKGEGISRLMGAKPIVMGAGDKFEKTLAEMQAHKGPVVIVAPLKTPERAEAKVKGDYGGNWGKLNDMLRGTVAVDTVHDIPKAMGALREAAKAQGWSIAQKPKTSMLNPGETHYRDVNLVLKSTKGMTAEVQINLKSMIAAKSEGHKYYEEHQALQRKIEGEKRTPTTEETATAEKLIAKQKKIYDDAWEKGGGTH